MSLTSVFTHVITTMVLAAMSLRTLVWAST